MSRYRFTGIKIDKDTGNRVLKSTLYPEIKINNGDRFVYPIDGDRLENLAYRYYGDSSLWWIIAKANGIRGKTALEIGKVIRIPSDIINTIEEFNSINEGG